VRDSQTEVGVSMSDPSPRKRGEGTQRHFFSMFHIGGTDGTAITPEMRSSR
jgi:hypothetical protein